MSEPVRITKSASAGELAECLGWLGEEIQKRATAQTREEVADALRDQFVDRSHTYVKFNGTTDDAIVEALRLSKQTKGQLVGLADRFDNDGVPADFRLGLAFAIAMIRDDEFEL
jgi:hypothetical protein